MCLFFESHPSKMHVFDVSREKFISPVPVHIRYVRFLSHIRTKRAFFDVSKKKFFTSEQLLVRESDIYVSLYPVSHTICQIFVYEDAKTAFFWCLLNFFCKKKDRQQCPSPFTRVSYRLSTYIYVGRPMPVPAQSPCRRPPWCPLHVVKL